MIRRFFGGSRSDEEQLVEAEQELAGGKPAKGVATLKTLAERGVMAAQLRLAQASERGQGMLQSFTDAVHWYRKAAEQGSIVAQAELGTIYLIGRAAPSVVTPTVAARQEQGRGGALDQLFPNGFAVRQDFAEAARWNKSAAEQGHVPARGRIGYQYAAGIGVPTDHKLAEHWLTLAADQGDAPAALCLGILLAGGHGAPPDYGRAAAIFAPLAEAGDATAQLCLAVLYLNGNGVAQDPVRAAELFAASATLGHPASMYHLGVMLAEGRGIAPDLSGAETWLRRATARGHLPALVSLGRLFVAGGTGSLEEAASLFRHAAELGSAEAQKELAELYLRGTGLPHDPDEAARWFHRAADQGSVAAIGALGRLHAEGIGVAQDFAAAADWLQRAAVEGSVAAQYHLGTLYQTGQGVPRDAERALDWFSRAAERGNAQAATRLGLAHALGQDVAQNFAVAAEWYRRGAAGHDLEAGFNLAFLHLQGFGVARDTAEGLRLLQDLAGRGYAPAAEALYHLYNSGDHGVLPDAVRSADYLARAAALRSDAASRLLARQHLGQGNDPKGAALARDLLEQAATRGSADAQVELGRLLQLGLAAAPDLVGARLWFERAAEAGHPDALAWLGDYFRSGLDGSAADLGRAVACYRAAAAKGHGGAAVMLANLLSEDPASREEAFALWLQVAKTGDVAAQRQVAECALAGWGTERDEAVARTWLEAACAQGDIAALLQFGALLVQADPVGATAYFARAAEQGSADGQYNLGVCYRRGLGVTQDLAAARHWYTVAARQGQSSAQLALGDLLLALAEGPGDQEEAVLWYEAAAASTPAACYNLAQLADAGIGMKRDPVRAEALYRQAEARGFRPAAHG